MRLGVIGTRYFLGISDCGDFVGKAIDKICAVNEFTVDEIVTGEMGFTDSFILWYAEEHHIPHFVIKCDLDHDDNKIGILVDMCDALVAFWDGKSGGTKRGIDLARAIGKMVYVVDYVGQGETP